MPLPWHGCGYGYGSWTTLAYSRSQGRGTWTRRRDVSLGCFFALITWTGCKMGRQEYSGQRAATPAKVKRTARYRPPSKSSRNATRRRQLCELYNDFLLCGTFYVGIGRFNITLHSLVCGESSLAATSNCLQGSCTTSQSDAKGAHSVFG